MKYFIASRWKNMKNVQLLTENLQALGHEVFAFVKDGRNFVPQKELGKKSEKEEKTREIFEKDLEGLRASDTVIMLLPAGPSSHIEAGIAFGLNKQVVLIGTPEEAETHYEIFEERYATIPEFLTSIKK